MAEIMERGYISLYRKIMETEFYRNINVCHFAIHCLLRANHEPSKILFAGEEITIGLGEFISGRKSLSEETGLSEQEIRTCIALLKKVNFITTQSTKKYTIFHIEKYDFFQSYHKKTTKKSTIKQPCGNHVSTTDNNLITKSQKQNLNPLYPLKKSQNFLNAWEQYLLMRKSLHKPATEHARQLLLQKLETLAPDNEIEQVEILEQSIENSWQKLLPTGGNYGTRQNNGVRSTEKNKYDCIGTTTATVIK
jgi:hypothetical protein